MKICLTVWNNMTENKAKISYHQHLLTSWQGFLEESLKMGVVKGGEMKNQKKWIKFDRETHYSERLLRLQTEFTKHQICNANWIDCVLKPSPFLVWSLSTASSLPSAPAFSLIEFFSKRFKNCHFKCKSDFVASTFLVFMGIENKFWILVF